jgi:hypothetical protein
MCRNCHASLVASLLASALVASATAQPPQVAPPETAPPVNREAVEAARRFFQESEQSRQVAEEVRRFQQKELEAETDKILQDGIDRINMDMRQREVNGARQQAAHGVLDAVILFTAVLGMGIYLGVKLRKRPAAEPPKPVE